ncbi:MAG: flagellar biosynthesis protein FliQ [Rhodospirillales bacterium]|nr:flagellar biosynthesis protein FliQ [Rhodospirillales bacterium]
MNAADVLEVAREAVIVMLMISGPVLAMALTVGLVVSLFQALTQIQEMTLAFVPKILAIFVSLLVLLPYMVSTLVTFGQSLMDRIVALG